MKKFLTILTILFASVCLQAQTKDTSLSFLKNAGNVNFIIDFSQAVIHGMSEQEFSEYEADWYKDKPDVIGKFLSDANEKLKNAIHLGNFPDANYTIKVIVNNISKKGDYYCNAVIMDKSGNVLQTLTNIYGRGGTFGTKLNLIKDGAYHTGEKFGTLLRKLINK